MRTRRRFSAEFKAKVALEAIKGHERRIDASVTSGTRQGSEYATGNARLSSEPNAVRYTESDIWRLACPRPSLGRNLEFLAVLGSAVDERLVSHTSRISLTQVLRPPVCFYAGRHTCVINRPHRKILRSGLARLPTSFPALQAARNTIVRVAASARPLPVRALMLTTDVVYSKRSWWRHDRPSSGGDTRWSVAAPHGRRFGRWVR